MKSCLAFILLLGCSLLTASAQGLGTVQRTFHTFRGDRTYTCLLIDGGAVPLTPSGTAKVSAGDGVSVNWPEDGAAAIIRPGSSGEAALLNLMGKPEAALAWKKYIVATLRDPGYTYLVHDFQPDVLDVNHWRIGAITMDYSIGGRKSSSLVMLWRCQNGSTLVVTMQASADHFKAHYDELFSMIGGAMVLK